MSTWRVAPNEQPDAGYGLTVMTMVPNRGLSGGGSWGGYGQQCWVGACTRYPTQTNLPVESREHCGAQTASPADLCGMHRTSLQ